MQSRGWPVAARPWWKRKTVLFIIAAVTVVADALGVGLGVGLHSGKGDDNSGGSRPSYNDTTCPRILTTATYESELYAFAHISSNTIAYRKYNGSWAKQYGLGDKLGCYTDPVSVSSYRPVLRRLVESQVNEFPRLKLLAISRINRGVSNM